MMRLIISNVLHLCVGSLLFITPIKAHSEDYYKNKTITIAVGGTAGSGLDTGARLISKYLSHHIAGEPNIRVELMPGAGGVRLLEYLYSVAPRDGTYIGAFATGPIIEPLISGRDVKYKTSDFTSVGAIENDISFCMTWHQSPIQTLKDAQIHDVTLAGTGAASSTDIFPVILNATLGTRFKVISGYIGTQETVMAVERGEVDGRCGWSWSSIKSSKPDWLREHKVNFLVQLGLEKHPEVKDVPLALDLISDEAERQMLRVLLAPQKITRPYLAPPGLSIEHAGIIRTGFIKTMNDPALREEFKMIVGDYPTPTEGKEMQHIIDDIYATPPAVVERLKGLLNSIR